MNLQESIRRILREEKLHATPQELVRNLPDELKKLLFNQWSAKQNPEWHPEGNTLKHILVVIRRAYHHYPDDPNMVMAALFHDLGKMDTYKINPKTNQPTAYGHEDKSTDYVEQYRNWIESFEGTDVDEIKYLVKNHMKVKPSTWDQMKDKKKEPIKSHPAFDKLMGFTDKLDGGGTHLKESIRRILREEIKNNYYLYENKNIEIFKTIDKTIREYIKQTLKLDTQINQYVPNTHIAEVFKDVLIYSELENENPEVFHNVKHHPYDTLNPNVDPNDYDVMDDGRFVKKETYSVGINDLLLPEYFDLKRLKENPPEEIHRVYQKLREKKDEVRNMLKLGRIVLPYEYTNRLITKSNKIKIR